jgi:rRNA maturation RNase YbeY
MISFNYETDFILEHTDQFSDWISKAISEESCREGEINYIFCSDDYLHKINLDFLAHDTLTDIISFDYSVGKELHGDIYISIDRVKDNASDFKVLFSDELARVIIHGVLHYCGYKDKSPEDAKVMRSKEDYYLAKRS